MPWAIVWPVLVVAALVGAFFLGRDLWHRGRALAGAASRAAQVASRFSDRADELAAAAAERHPVPPVALLRDRAELRAARDASGEAHDRRIDARHARDRLVMARWRDVWR